VKNLKNSFAKVGA
jgi:hypothetical protein